MKTTIALFLLTFLLGGNYLQAQYQTVQDVKVQGNKRMRASFVKKLVKVKPGQVLDSAQMDLDVAKLKRLAGISHAYYQVFPSGDNSYNVIYNIEENFTIIPGLNIWTVNDQRVAYKVSVYDFNLFGRNIAFGGFYQNNGYDSYGVNFKAPYLFSNRLGLGVNHQNWSSQEPLFFSNGSAQYLYNNRSFEVVGLFELNFKNNVQLGVNYFAESYDFLGGITDPSIPQRLKLKKWMLKFVYEYDNLDYYYYFVSGFKSNLYLQYVTSENDFQNNFLIGWNDFRYFKRVGEKGNWANRLRFGVASNSDSPFAPFSVDNNLNIRGVGNIIDRGTASLVLNTEYRYTLFEKSWFVLQGNAFIDAGTWRNPGGSFSDFWKSENVRVFPGVGLRFIHKNIFNATFRIDYGYGVTNNDSNGIVFGIGQYF